MGDRHTRRAELLRELEALDRVKDEPRSSRRRSRSTSSLRPPSSRHDRREREWFDRGSPFDVRSPGRSASRRRDRSRGRRGRSTSVWSQSRYVRRTSELPPREPKRESKLEVRMERSRSRRAGNRPRQSRDVSPEPAPHARRSRSPSQRYERRSARHADDAHLPPPVGRMVMGDASHGRSPASQSPPPRQRELAEFNAAPKFDPKIDHYRWNVIENAPGWSITASVWGPPKPTLSDPHGKLSMMWIYDNKRRGWKIHEIVEGHPSSKYGQYTPDAVRQPRAPPPAPRPVPRAPGADAAGSSRTVKKEEPVKREPSEGGGHVEL